MTYREHMHESCMQYWRELMKRTRGNVARSAKLAGVNRTHAFKLLERCGLSPQMFRNRPTQRRQGLRGNTAWRELGR